MKKTGFLPRFTALFLTLALALPGPAHALRPMMDKAGLEERMSRERERDTGNPYQYFASPEERDPDPLEEDEREKRNIKVGLGLVAVAAALLGAVLLYVMVKPVVNPASPAPAPVPAPVEGGRPVEGRRPPMLQMRPDGEETRYFDENGRREVEVHNGRWRYMDDKRPVGGRPRLAGLEEGGYLPGVEVMPGAEGALGALDPKTVVWSLGSKIWTGYPYAWVASQLADRLGIQGGEAVVRLTRLYQGNVLWSWEQLKAEIVQAGLLSEEALDKATDPRADPGFKENFLKHVAENDLANPEIYLMPGVFDLLGCFHGVGMHQMLVGRAEKPMIENLLGSLGIRGFFETVQGTPQGLSGGSKAWSLPRQLQRNKGHEVVFISSIPEIIAQARGAGFLAVAVAPDEASHRVFTAMPPDEAPQVIIRKDFSELDRILTTLKVERYLPPLALAELTSHAGRVADPETGKMIEPWGEERARKVARQAVLAGAGFVVSPAGDSVGWMAEEIAGSSTHLVVEIGYEKLLSKYNGSNMGEAEALARYDVALERKKEQMSQTADLLGRSRPGLAFEFDIVINLKALLESRLAPDGTTPYVEWEIGELVRHAREIQERIGRPIIVKIVGENAHLEPDQMRSVYGWAREHGADFVKSSTGYAPGGATLPDLERMREIVGPDMGIEAAGGNLHSLSEVYGALEALGFTGASGARFGQDLFRLGVSLGEDYGEQGRGKEPLMDGSRKHNRPLWRSRLEGLIEPPADGKEAAGAEAARAANEFALELFDSIDRFLQENRRALQAMPLEHHLQRIVREIDARVEARASGSDGKPRVVRSGSRRDQPGDITFEWFDALKSIHASAGIQGERGFVAFRVNGHPVSIWFNRFGVVDMTTIRQTIERFRVVSWLGRGRPDPGSFSYPLGDLFEALHLRGGRVTVLVGEGQAERVRRLCEGSPGRFDGSDPFTALWLFPNRVDWVIHPDSIPPGGPRVLDPLREAGMTVQISEDPAAFAADRLLGERRRAGRDLPNGNRPAYRLSVGTGPGVGRMLDAVAEGISSSSDRDLAGSLRVLVPQESPPAGGGDAGGAARLVAERLAPAGVLESQVVAALPGRAGRERLARFGGIDQIVVELGEDSDFAGSRPGQIPSIRFFPDLNGIFRPSDFSPVRVARKSLAGLEEGGEETLAPRRDPRYSQMVSWPGRFNLLNGFIAGEYPNGKIVEIGPGWPAHTTNELAEALAPGATLTAVDNFIPVVAIYPAARSETLDSSFDSVALFNRSGALHLMEDEATADRDIRAETREKMRALREKPDRKRAEAGNPASLTDEEGNSADFDPLSGNRFPTVEGDILLGTFSDAATRALGGADVIRAANVIVPHIPARDRWEVIQRIGALMKPGARLLVAYSDMLLASESPLMVGFSRGEEAIEYVKQGERLEPASFLTSFSVPNGFDLLRTVPSDAEPVFGNLFQFKESLSRSNPELHGRLVRARQDAVSADDAYGGYDFQKIRQMEEEAGQALAEHLTWLGHPSYYDNGMLRIPLSILSQGDLARHHRGLLSPAAGLEEGGGKAPGPSGLAPISDVVVGDAARGLLERIKGDVMAALRGERPEVAEGSDWILSSGEGKMTVYLPEGIQFMDASDGAILSGRLLAVIPGVSLERARGMLGISTLSPEGEFRARIPGGESLIPCALSAVGDGIHLETKLPLWGRADPEFERYVSDFLMIGSALALPVSEGLAGSSVRITLQGDASGIAWMDRLRDWVIGKWFADWKPVPPYLEREGMDGWRTFDGFQTVEMFLTDPESGSAYAEMLISVPEGSWDPGRLTELCGGRSPPGEGRSGFVAVTVESSDPVVLRWNRMRNADLIPKGQFIFSVSPSSSGEGPGELEILVRAGDMGEMYRKLPLITAVLARVTLDPPILAEEARPADAGLEEGGGKAQSAPNSIDTREIDAEEAWHASSRQVLSQLPPEVREVVQEFSTFVYSQSGNGWGEVPVGSSSPIEVAIGSLPHGFDLNGADWLEIRGSHAFWILLMRWINVHLLLPEKVVLRFAYPTDTDRVQLELRNVDGYEIFKLSHSEIPSAVVYLSDTHSSDAVEERPFLSVAYSQCGMAFIITDNFDNHMRSSWIEEVTHNDDWLRALRLGIFRDASSLSVHGVLSRLQLRDNQPGLYQWILSIEREIPIREYADPVFFAFGIVTEARAVLRKLMEPDACDFFNKELVSKYYNPIPPTSEVIRNSQQWVNSNIGPQGYSRMLGLAWVRDYFASQGFMDQRVGPLSEQVTRDKRSKELGIAARRLWRQNFSDGSSLQVEWIRPTSKVEAVRQWADIRLRSLAAGLEERDAEFMESIVQMPGIPAVADLLAILEKEEVPAIVLRPGDLAFLFLLDPHDGSEGQYQTRILDGTALTPEEEGFWREKAVFRGKVLSADSIRWFVETLQKKGDGFPAGAATLERFAGRSQIVLLSAHDDRAHRTLLEETFHVLEGNPMPESAASQEHSLEAVNDLLQTMFFPAESFGMFSSPYTDWSEEEMMALQKRYREDAQVNPNYDLRKVIEKLKADVEADGEKDAGIPIIGGQEIKMVDLLFRVYLARAKDSDVPSWRERCSISISDYLHALLETERFSRHQPLFPSWALPAAGLEEGGVAAQLRTQARYIVRSTGFAEQVERAGGILPIPTVTLGDEDGNTQFFKGVAIRFDPNELGPCSVFLRPQPGVEHLYLKEMDFSVFPISDVLDVAVGELIAARAVMGADLGLFDSTLGISAETVGGQLRSRMGESHLRVVMLRPDQVPGLTSHLLDYFAKEKNLTPVIVLVVADVLQDDAGNHYALAFWA